MYPTSGAHDLAFYRMPERGVYHHLRDILAIHWAIFEDATIMRCEHGLNLVRVQGFEEGPMTRAKLH